MTDKATLDMDPRREYAEFAKKVKGVKPIRILVIEYFEGESLPNVELFGVQADSHAEAIGMFGEGLMALGAAVLAANAEMAN